MCNDPERSLSTVQNKVLQRLATYPVLSLALLEGPLKLQRYLQRGKSLREELSELVQLNLIQTAVVRSGRDIVTVYYRTDRADLVEAVISSERVQ